MPPRLAACRHRRAVFSAVRVWRALKRGGGADSVLDRAGVARAEAWFPRRQWLLGGVLGVAVAGLAYWRRALTLDGAVAAAVVGCIAFARGGASGAAAPLAFFGSSTLLSRIGESRKQHLPLAQAKGAQRDVWQVLANGGVATMCFGLGQRSAAIGALAAAGADTWATELGLLAREPPRLITTLRHVAPGTSGGVTPEGLLASIGGALTVGLGATLFGGRDRRTLTAAVLAGLAGALVDSLVGATLQAVYYCPNCEVLTEVAVHPRCGTPAIQQRGLQWMTNDVVNLLATSVGAAIGLQFQTPNAAEHVRGGG
jgi:uncharacterized protein (TIGR00297 family)